MAWKTILNRVETTQTINTVVVFKPPSLDSMAKAIQEAQNVLVIWEATLAQFEADVTEERARISAEFNSAQDALMARCQAMQDRHDQMGLQTCLKPLLVITG